MSVHEKKLNWRLAGETRMKKIEPNDKLSKEHIKKAKDEKERDELNYEYGTAPEFLTHKFSRCFFRLGVYTQHY
ncbi:MAG: hypothetical protein KAK00_05780 [Nanoarchaeota archaeon]|nr:hypothetical protein [Nanoarchaeota archaeon]